MYFGWVIAQNSRYHNDFFTICEPALGSKPCLGLCWGGQHHEECGYPDNKGDQTAASPISPVD